MTNPIELENRIADKRNSLSTGHLDMSFGELMGMYARKELIISPDYQRMYRWTDEQKTRLVESILLGIPLPPIFVAEDRTGAWELVDGLQRISTILSFFGELKCDGAEKFNNWICTRADLVPELEGVQSKTLPYKFQLNIKRAVCRVESIKWDSQWDIRYELFSRLNTGGTPLTDQEVRNSVFRSGLKKFYRFIEEAKTCSEFMSLTSLTEAQRRKLFDEELIVRYVALVDAWQDVRSTISDHATAFMKNMLRRKEDISPKTIERFYEAVHLLAPLGPSVFRVRTTFSPSLFDSLMVATSHYLQRILRHPSTLSRAVAALKENPSFRAMRGNASSTTRTRQRLEVAMDVFEKVCKDS